MVSKIQHKFDEKGKCVGCGLSEEQVEDRKIVFCKGKLIKKIIKNSSDKEKKKFI